VSARTAILLVLALPVAARTAAHAQVPRFGGQDDQPPPIRMPSVRDVPRGATDLSPALRCVRRDGTVVRVAGGSPPPPVDELRVASADGFGMLASPGAAVLVLPDGQRLVGALDADGGKPVWVSPWVAPRAIELDGIRGLVMPGGTLQAATDEDVVELRNGDRMTGIVASIAPGKVTVERGSGDAAERFEVAMQDVRSISLVGTDAPWRGVRAWLVDGSVIDAPDAEWLGGDNLRFPGLAGAKLPMMTVPRRSVAAIQRGPGAARALASMVPVAAHPEGTPEDRRREHLPLPRAEEGTWSLDAPPLEIEGPVVLRYDGAPQASRLTMVVQRPAPARAAGTPEIVVRSGGREVVRERLGPDRATVELRAELGPGAFEIALVTPDGSVTGCFAVLQQALLLPAE